GVARHELVDELLAGRDWGLGQAGYAVHVVRQAHAVPVNAGRLGQGVLETYDDPVADLRTDVRTGKHAVIRPHGRRLARDDFHVGDARLELDLEDIRGRVEVDGDVHRQLVGP